MKKLLLFCISNYNNLIGNQLKYTMLLLILPFFINSCGSTKDIESGDTLMWEIKKGNNKIYILGSIHIASKDMYPLHNAIESAYKESKNIAVEIDMNNINQMEMAMKLMLQDGTKLQDHISEENYNALKKIFDKNNIPEMAFSMMKPFGAVQMAQMMYFSEKGFSGTDGIDMHFLNRAEKDGKEVYELETADFQLSLFEKFDEIADEFVEYSLKSLDSSSTELDDMINAWIDADTEKLISLLNSAVDENPNFEEIYTELVDKRNINMTKKIKKWLNSGETFFVIVGAGHLIGDVGIINILKEENQYEIKRY